MTFSQKIVLWMLEHRRDLYLRVKKLNGHVIAKDDRFFDIHLQLLRDRKGTQTLWERYNLYCLVQGTARLPGALAEAGVYQGGSAKLVCMVKGKTPLYLFDTFEGLPEGTLHRDPGFGAGQFSDSSLEEVKAYLQDFDNVQIYKGLFPASAAGQEPERQNFRFVHLDLDLYQSTLDALGFFYPRMVKGGVMLSHDYGNINGHGVRDAFQQFFADKTEPVIPLWDTQCLIVKT